MVVYLEESVSIIYNRQGKYDSALNEIFQEICSDNLNISTEIIEIVFHLLAQ